MGHVGFSDPFDNDLRDVIIKAVSGQGVLQGESILLHEKGTLVCMGKPCPLSYMLSSLLPVGSNKSTCMTILELTDHGSID